MKKIGLVGEKIRGQKIGVKNSDWKIDGKNWASRWKNSRLENWDEKLKISLKFSAKIFQFLQNCPKFFRSLKLFFPNCLLLLESLDIMKHTDTLLVTTQLDDLSFGSEYDAQSESLSCIVFKYPYNSRFK